MGVVVLRDPFVVAVVCLHVVAVLFLDELAFHAEVGNNILVSSIKNIIIDLVHPDVALLYLLFGHDAVSAGYVRGGGRSGRVRRGALSCGLKSFDGSSPMASGMGMPASISGRYQSV